MTAVRTNAETEAREAEAMDRISLATGSEVGRYGKFNPIDCYAMKGDKLFFVAELKCRDVKYDKYETIYLSLKKWSVLIMAEFQLHVPAYFIVYFNDGRIYQLRVVDMTVTAPVKLRGRNRDNPEAKDWEPMVEVNMMEFKLVMK